MPIYEYECSRCGAFEVSQRITEAPLKKCPTCRGKVSKLISHTSFQLKGSGWYVTDYASKGSGSGKKEEGKKDDTKPAASESKTDSKGDSSKSDAKKTEANAA
jgi:putative FmdB family regulatory protein